MVDKVSESSKTIEGVVSDRSLNSMPGTVDNNDCIILADNNPNARVKPILIIWCPVVEPVSEGIPGTWSIDGRLSLSAMPGCIARSDGVRREVGFVICLLGILTGLWEQK